MSKHRSVWDIQMQRWNGGNPGWFTVDTHRPSAPPEPGHVLNLHGELHTVVVVDHRRRVLQVLKTRPPQGNTR